MTDDRVNSTPHPQVPDAARLRAANVRTAAILFAIAIVFFGGFIASRYMGDMATGMTVIGLAVFLFLVVAIGRNLRSRQ